MKQLSELCQGLSWIQKIEAVLAAVITAVLLAGTPVYAWFAFMHKAETMTKVREPNNLDIRAGNAEDVKYFDLNDIDIEKITADSPQCYVFCVVTENIKTYYDLQIAHTTNIPVTYTLYRAEQDTGEKPDAKSVSYTTHNPDGTEAETIYYKRVSPDKENDAAVPLTLETMNADTTENDTRYGRKLAPKNDSYYKLAYEENDDPQIYAIAKYEQVKELETRDPSHDFYILELGIATENKTTGFEKWNVNENNKETDIIYITASRTIK